MPALTNAAIRSLQPADKPQRHWDGDGLYLEVSPTGAKLWRWKYRFSGKEKRLALGAYPEVGLADARERVKEARSGLREGQDPCQTRRAAKDSLFAFEQAQHAFEVVAREWHRIRLVPRVSDGQATRVLGRLERDIFPWIGPVPIADLSAPRILQTLRRVEARGAIETAHRELQTIGQVLRYAVATGRAERDVSADLRGALEPVNPRHMSAITDPIRVGELLRAIDGYQGSFVVASALRLAPLVFQRPGELRGARWSEIDLDEAMWRIPAARMKRTKAKKANGQDHLVPLSRQAVAILRELHPLTGHRQLVFPSTVGEGRPLSDGTLGAALRRLGFAREEMSAHGFRAMARTLAVERLGEDEAVVEAQLAHTVRDALGRAYNRTQFVDQRRALMQRWADYLDKLKAQHQPVPRTRRSIE